MNPEDNQKITLDYFNKFDSREDLINRWLEYFQSIGLALDDIDNWRKFIESNSYNLYLEAQHYGLDKTNPFFTFLSKFVTQNKSILILNNLYGTLHNLVARQSIDEKQLAFTCPEDEQIRILMNKSLYQNNTSDFTYLIRSYNWLLNLDINRDIKNKYIIKFFKNSSNTDRIALIKNIYFTDAITKFMLSQKTEADENTFLSAVFKPTSLVSSPLINCDNIEQNIKWLDENIQESGRGINGQYQEKDSIESNNKNDLNSNFITPSEIKYLKDKLTPLLDDLAKKANIGNKKATDVIKIIKSIW